MNDKLKKILVPFILMIICEMILSSKDVLDLGLYCPHIGLFFVCGLLLGPYGALGGRVRTYCIEHYGWMCTTRNSLFIYLQFWSFIFGI